MDLELAEQLAARDRFMRHRWQSLTHAQRVAEMMRLQQASFDLLRRSPDGYAHWLRRNFKSRAITPPGDADAT